MIDLLEGIRVVDLSALGASLLSSALADLGAEVIKVEELPGGDYFRALEPKIGATDLGLMYAMWNRNKRSVALDLRSDPGRTAMLDLVGTADVVIDSARPGARDRRGLGNDALRTARPDLIICSVTGFGQTGPYRAMPSHGVGIDGAAGVISIAVGEDGKPEMEVTSALGLERAASYGAFAVAAALLRRARTGEGAVLDVSMWDASIAQNIPFLGAVNPGPGAIIHPFTRGGFGARYDTYGTKDDRVLLIAPIERKFWASFCDAVGRPDWLDRGEPGAVMEFGRGDTELAAELEKMFRSRNRDEWLELFESANVPVTPVPQPSELVDDPHVRARGMVVRARVRGTEVAFVRPPVVVDDDEFEVSLLPPEMGAHTIEVFRSLGYDDAQLAALGAEPA